MCPLDCQAKLERNPPHSAHYSVFSQVPQDLGTPQCNLPELSLLDTCWFPQKGGKGGKGGPGLCQSPSPCPSGLVWSSAVEPWHQRRPPAPSNQNPSGCGPPRPQPSPSADIVCRYSPVFLPQRESYFLGFVITGKRLSIILRPCFQKEKVVKIYRSPPHTRGSGGGLGHNDKRSVN